MGLTRDQDNWKLFLCLPWTGRPCLVLLSFERMFLPEEPVPGSCSTQCQLSVWIQPRSPVLQTDPSCAVLQCTPVAACCHHCLCASYCSAACQQLVKEAFLRGWDTAEAEGCSYSGSGCRDAEPSDCLE